MNKSILAAASVVALGISSFGVDAALTGALGPSSSSGQTTQWMAGYGVPATPAQMARVWQEVAYYRKLAGKSQQRAEIGTIREIGTTIRELEFPGG
jgi:hypothetical protein